MCGKGTLARWRLCCRRRRPSCGRGSRATWRRRPPSRRRVFRGVSRSARSASSTATSGRTRSSRSARRSAASTPSASTRSNVLGVLSLIFWALMLVITVKYLTFVMRATNDGEGGILALLGAHPREGASARVLVLVILFGAALLYGDGVVTPAISVLSAVEGLKSGRAVARDDAIVPITCVILVALFLVQRRGTAGHRRRLRPRDGRLVRRDRRARRACRSRARPSCSSRDQPDVRAMRFFDAAAARRVRRPRRGHPLHRGRRGALRRHGPLRAKPDRARLVRARASRRSSSTTSGRARSCSAGGTPDPSRVLRDRAAALLLCR